MVDVEMLKVFSGSQGTLGNDRLSCVHNTKTHCGLTVMLSEDDADLCSLYLKQKLFYGFGIFCLH